eukprot:TRINITY_DN56330_c0_g1_i1.p1 TRINITY_DN56330_c0_g1~~TRINITY_DN56330_c0_g1_i1.p1  ORF type:complete len:558 (+),score=69.35 TRINITY_DN56330_c0_g1_i1:423-2096(+)
MDDGDALTTIPTPVLVPVGEAEDPPQPRGQWGPRLPSPPLDVDPRLHLALDESLACALGEGMPRVRVLGVAQYSFSVAAYGSDAVLALEYNRRTLRKLQTRPRAWEEEGRDIPLGGDVEGLGGAYSVVSTQHGSDILIAIDGSDAAGGSVRLLSRNGSARTVIRDIRGPRQMALDAKGGVWIAEEIANRVGRWIIGSGRLDFVVGEGDWTPPECPQGVAVSCATGDVYWSEYGCMGDANVALSPGCVRVRRGDSGQIKTLRADLWRCRGVALDEVAGCLYVVCEANAWDQGSSGSITRLDLRTGRAVRVAHGLDYPQCPCLCRTAATSSAARGVSDGRSGAFAVLAVPLVRHNVVVALDIGAPEPVLQSPFRGVTLSMQGGLWRARLNVCLNVEDINGMGEPPVFHVSVRPDGGLFGIEDTSNGYSSVSESVLLSGHIFISGHLDGNDSPRCMTMWVRLAKERLPAMYREELPYGNSHSPTPGRFVMPRVRCAAPAGFSSFSYVFPLHEHRGARWPMLLVSEDAAVDRRHRGRQFPAAMFSEKPEAYLVFIRLSERR